MLLKRVEQDIEKARADSRNTDVGALMAYGELLSDRDAVTLAMKTGHDIPAGEEVPPSRVTRAVLQKQGNFWTIEFGRFMTQLRQSTGLLHLARLVEKPGREFHCLELIALSEGHVRGSQGRPAAEGLHTDGGGGGDPLLDQAAVEAYRARLADLEEEVEEAVSHADMERAELARRETDAITRELVVAFGLGGRHRDHPGAPAERARSAVSKALHRLLDRLEREAPPLARHLHLTISIGTFCSYRPERDRPVQWEL